MSITIILGVTTDDAGAYQIELTNRAGDKKCEAALTVHCKLHFLYNIEIFNASKSENRFDKPFDVRENTF